MKKIICVLFIICLLVCFAACNGTQDQPTVPNISNSPTEPVITVPDPSAGFTPDPIYENMYSVSMPITVETTHNKDGNTVFTYAYQSMHLIIPDSAVADKIIIDFLNRVESTQDDANQLKEAALRGESTYPPYSYQIIYSTTRIDQGILSLYGSIINVNDAIHAGFKCISANYDIVTGDVLTLGSILYHADAKDDLTALVIEELEQQEGLMLFDDYRDTVNMRFARDESTDEDFYFTPHGLCFYFSPYEIAPFSAGTVSVQIPYSKLTGIIGDAYFPAERIAAAGNIQITPFDEVDLETIEQFTEIIDDAQGTKLILTSDAGVQDVRIQKITWTADGYAIAQCDTIFASNVLCVNDAILFEGDFSGDKPGYILSFTQNKTEKSFYLVKDSITGQIILTNA